MKQWAKKNKITIPEPEDKNLGAVYDCGSYIFILVKEDQPHWDIIDTIVHESVHVFQKAMKYVQEASPGIETEAYHIASITVNLLKDFHALHDQRKT